MAIIQNVMLCKTSTAQHPKHTVKHDGGSIMLWACFSPPWTGKMVKLYGKMDESVPRKICRDFVFHVKQFACLKIPLHIFMKHNEENKLAKIAKLE